MKIALAQINYHTGHFDANLDKMLERIGWAEAEDADVVVFSELSFCGYPPRDFLEFEDFINKCEAGIARLCAASHKVAVLAGAPARNTSGRGKPLFNAAYFMHGGQIAAIAHKILLPTYDIFDEDRYFESGGAPVGVTFRNLQLALTICEDLWNVGENPIYKRRPLDELSGARPDLILNIAASPFSRRQPRIRGEVLAENARHYQAPLVYVNHVGAQTELIFDGHSTVYNAQGRCIRKLAAFEEDFGCFDTDTLTAMPAVDPPEAMATEEAHFKALVLGLRDYFTKLGFHKALLGMSGGIDSALVHALAAEALGPEQVLAVLMPSRYSTEGSVVDARKQVENIGGPSKTIPIQPIFQCYLDQLNTHFEGTEEGIAEENLQSRARADVLMALSNKFGHILLNTSNKSELAVGYGTLYGDMCGGLSVIGDLYKTEAYRLSRYINTRAGRELIPREILEKEPSAELKFDQRDTDALPPYDQLDPLLYDYIERRMSPRHLIEKGYPQNLVNRVLRLVNINEYKRHQAPPILRISEKAFGMGRRVPIVARYLA